MLHESVRGNDLRLASSDVSTIRYTQHTTVVVTMAVGIDHRDYGFLTELFGHELHRRPRRFNGSQRVYHQPAASGIDERNDGHVKTAHLPDAIRDLVQAVFGQDLRLPPQTRVGRCRRLVFQEVVGTKVI